MKNLLVILLFSFFLMTCQNNAPKDNTAGDPEVLTFQLTELWSTDTVMITPESVLFDPGNNVLYVANMNLSEEIDGNGFISKLATDGSIIDLHWITGLNDPKGMGIYGNLLFVTDINAVVVIDLEKVEIKETIAVDKAEFLNDLAIDKDGKVYFTDSETGKIHTYENGVVAEWIIEGLERPNGLYNEENDMLLASSGSGDVRRIDKSSREMTIIAEGIGRGDGMSYSGIESYYLVSSWSGEIFVIGQDTVQSVLDTQEQKKNTADFGYNMEERILYVPTFFDNRVVAYKLEVK